MVSKSLFEKLDFVARRVRKVEDVPFGGIQLVLSGDFFQLPPVTSFLSNIKEQFCFKSTIWKSAIQCHVELTHIHRQTDDMEFVSILKKIRKGEDSDECLHYLRSLKRPLSSDDNVESVTLFSNRFDSTLYNVKKLSALEGQVTTFHSKDQGPSLKHD